MLNPDAHLAYIETLTLSLLAAHGDGDAKVVDPLAGPSLTGFTIAPGNARAEIAAQRQARE